VPALVGQIIITLRDDAGVTIFTITESYTDGTGMLRDATVSTSTGNKVGALVVDNQTGSSQRVAVLDSAGTEIRSFNITPSGASLTVAQLSAIGVTTIQHLNGITPVLD
jgi:hypothetical protein